MTDAAQVVAEHHAGRAHAEDAKAVQEALPAMSDCSGPRNAVEILPTPYRQPASWSCEAIVPSYDLRCNGSSNIQKRISNTASRGAQGI